MREGSRREKQREEKEREKEYGGVRENLSPISHGLIWWGLQFLIYLGEAS